MQPVYISLGCACTVKTNLKNLTIPERLPFDWIISPIQFVIDSLDNNFTNWSDPEEFRALSIHKPNGYLRIEHKTSKAVFVHDLKPEHLITSINIANYYDSNGYSGNLPIKFESLQLLIDNYQRRAQRFYDLVHSGRPLIFVRYSGTPLVDTKEEVIALFTSLKKYCQNKFVLLHISENTKPENIKSENILEPLSNENGKYVFVQLDKFTIGQILSGYHSHIMKLLNE